MLKMSEFSKLFPHQTFLLYSIAGKFVYGIANTKLSINPACQVTRVLAIAYKNDVMLDTHI